MCVMRVVNGTMRLQWEGVDKTDKVEGKKRGAGYKDKSEAKLQYMYQRNEQ